MAENINIHEGHRQRLKERFRREGLDNFDEINALELLLFYCVQRKDTNPLAHRLLNRFGNLSTVLNAPLEALVQVEGVTEHVATYLSLLRDFIRYFQMREASNVTVLNSVEDCGRYIVPYFQNRREEVVIAMYLDAKRKLLCCKEVGEGSVSAAMISIRKIVEYAIHYNATSVVLAHNHPTGLAFPSAEDCETTQRLADALSAMNIYLADHLIVADYDFISLAQSGRFIPRR